MTITVYDLAGADEKIRFSPFCWRTKLALMHKGLAFDTAIVRFVDIPHILGGGYETVPIITDGDQTVVDSWEIAKYLDRAYPDRPPLCDGAAVQAMTAFVGSWTYSVLMMGILDLIIVDIVDMMNPEDKAYYRRTREARFGRKLEDIQAGRDDRLEDFREKLAPLRQTLEEYPFLAGNEPMYADYIVIGAFIWAASASDYPLLAKDDPIYDWRERCFDLHDGAAREGLPQIG